MNENGILIQIAAWWLKAKEKKMDSEGILKLQINIFIDFSYWQGLINQAFTNGYLSDRSDAITEMVLKEMDS